jgi:hypothetical protein
MARQESDEEALWPLLDEARARKLGGAAVTFGKRRLLLRAG